LGWSPVIVEAEIQQVQSQFPMLDDSAGVFENWLQLVKAHAVQGKKVHDARLVAVMQTYGITHLLTFNYADFQRYPNIVVISPSDL
jgi:predicted nucleic acid-binding protein